ncbi:MAG: S8 family peptidase [Elusimicrobiota bacterium]
MTKRSALVPFAVLALTLASWVCAESAGTRKNTKIVLFKEFVSEDLKQQLIATAGGRVVRELSLVNGVEVEFTATAALMTWRTAAAVSSTQSGEQKLKAKYQVETVEPNEYRNWLVSGPAALQSVVIPSAQQFLRQAIQNKAAAPAVGEAAAKAEAQDKKIPWGVSRVKAPAVWERSTGAGVKVGIIDTGIDYTHPALKANYKGGTNTATKGGDAKDDHGHGTHVAGTIAAAGDDIVGVAPQASLYAIKVLDENGYGTTASIVDGLAWCVENKMNIVNMSLGGPASEALEKAVKAAVAAGVTIVAASGNDPDSSVSAPARYSEVIAVSASTSQDGSAEFSSTGPEVDFIAPGNEVLSTYPGGGTATMSGTSMATPHVAGLAALARGLGADTPAAVRAMLQKSATPLKDLKPEQQGAGMIEADRFLR